jgi:dipeptidyl aminopeptidase/acylaminoacyl peptidase
MATISPKTSPTDRIVSVGLGLSELWPNFESASGGSTPPGATNCFAAASADATAERSRGTDVRDIWRVLAHTPGVTKSRFGLVCSSALVLLVAAIGGLVSDASQASAVAKPMPARNGLIAYSYAGDIYVGNPVTGKTTQITTNPRYEVNPVFSPNGKRIAFVRGDPQTKDSTIVVVRADGSDERVVLPKERKHRGFGVLAWTPDGSSLVVELDRLPFTYPHGDGELSLFDSSGSGGERILTPPLSPSIGAHYFSTSEPVAPMFRPPSGDEIWSEDLRVFGRDLRMSRRVEGDMVDRYQRLDPFWLTWSPDGTRFAFRTPGRGLYVMSATGDKLHQLANGDPIFFQWSPDGSRIAYEHLRGKADRAVIAIRDLRSSERRLLESTSATGKDAGARFPTLTYNNVVHHWYYEGWIWAPDGRSLLVFEDHRTRPWVVDVERDTITKLPWLADSMPSWQRVPRK